ncbi:MAG TPA: cysteine desulfurase family protein [Patescibacteria group bacterium]|nr:cysteine desulfurase family protein [Patescibacteria group bacterium]
MYLDYAAATPLDEKVKAAMAPFWQKQFGNPSAQYQLGRTARQAVDGARARIAQTVRAQPKEIVFTAGGTESVNLAIFGAVRNFLLGGAGERRRKFSPHLIVSAVEHECVLNSARALEAEGCRVTYLPVDRLGRVSLADVQQAVGPETVLISIMYANNEIGTVQPVAEIGRWLKTYRHKSFRRGKEPLLFHTDACQAAGYLDLDVEELGVDLMSVNGGKLYGPKQTGFLYVRSGVSLKPLLYGGGQEFDLRGGTENVPGIVGLAESVVAAQAGRAKESARLSSLAAKFYRQVKEQVPGVLLNGPACQPIKGGDKIERLPNNLNFTFPAIDSEALMFYLDSYGIAASTASACSSNSNGEPSHVLLAIGKTERQAKSSIRFTMGRQTRQDELNYVLKVLTSIVAMLSQVENIK